MGAIDPVPSAMWLWCGPEASVALASRDLSVISRAYRSIHGISQQELAARLGYDKTYISMIETRRRTISDIGTLRHIAHVLGLPPYVLGITESDAIDFSAMIQFGESTIRLAEVARQSGRAGDAVDELWPLVIRLEARAGAGGLDRYALGLLGNARLALGVCLGTVLPEERLASAARWTGRAVQIANLLDDQEVRARSLRMHGNELRKAGHPAAAVARLERSLSLSRDVRERGSALAFLARAHGERGDAEGFDRALGECRALLDERAGSGVLFNRFSVREIHLRGLLATNRVAEAVDVAARMVPGVPDAPQWQVIERITTGHALLAGGDRAPAEIILSEALTAAEAGRLPHQVQRLARIARRGLLADLTHEATAALGRLRIAALSPRPHPRP